MNRCARCIPLLVLWLLCGSVSADVILRAGTVTELEPLSPMATSGFWYGVGYTGLVHMPLVTYQPPDARFGPCLARTWEVAADNRSITFQLHDGARWHDGRAVTADDVAFTLEYLKEHQIIGQLWRFLERVEVHGPLEVEVFFTDPVAFYQSMFFPWPKIVPRHVWASVEAPETFQGERAMVGCGPFAFVRYDEDARVAHLQKVDGFFAGESRLDAVQVRFFGSTEALVLALKQGVVDVIMGPNPSIPPAYAPGLEGVEGLELVEVDNGGVPLTLVFNYGREPVRRQLFREAVAHAIDYAALSELVMRGRGDVPERGFVPRGAWTYAGPFPSLGRDLERARALLDSLGFIDGDGDGWREDAAGEMLQLEIVAETWQSHGETLRAAELVAYQLGQAGVRAEMVKYVVEQEYEKLWEQRDYQAYLGYATHASTRDGGHVYFARYRDFSYGTWEDSAYLALLDRITASPDEVAYRETVRQAQEYNARQLPGLALAWAPQLFAFRSDRFGGWQPLASYGFPNYASWFSLEPVEEGARPEEERSWMLWMAVLLLILTGMWIFKARQKG